MMKVEYLYKGYKITAWAVRKFGGTWNGGATITNQLGTQGTAYEQFPTPEFSTEKEALETAKKLAEDRVDIRGPSLLLADYLSRPIP
jgi:hypothetical protein